MTITHQALLAMRFIQEEAYRVDNFTYKYDRSDYVEECMDQIANNQTDLTGNWASLKTQVPHVAFFAIIDASASVILSAYDQVTSTSGTSVLSSFRAWSPVVIIAFCFLFLSAFMLFTAHSAIYRNHKQVLAKMKKGKYWEKMTVIRKPACHAQHLLCIIFATHDFSLQTTFISLIKHSPQSFIQSFYPYS